MVYVADEDLSELFESESNVEEIRRYTGSAKQWLEAGGVIELPQTISFQVSTDNKWHALMQSNQRG